MAANTTSTTTNTTNTTTTGITKPHKHDVLLGRGGASNHHHGNAVFRSVVSKTRPMYRTVPKHQKIIVARSIVHAVGKQDPPGRFLERDKGRGGAGAGGGASGAGAGGGGGGLWYEVSFERAVEKAKQALRERGKDEGGGGAGDGSDDEDGEEGTADDGGMVARIPPAGMPGFAPGRGTGASSTGASGGRGGGGGGGGAGTRLLPAPLIPNVIASSSAAAPIGTLTPEEESVAVRYRNMIHLFHVAPSVVESKMRNEDISERIIRSVLEGAPPPPPALRLQQQQTQQQLQQQQQQQQQQGEQEHHVQFAAGTHAAAPLGGGVRTQPRARRVSSVLLSMLGFGDDSTNDDGGGAGGSGGAAGGLPPEVRDVIDDIVAEEDSEGPTSTVEAAAASSSGVPAGFGGTNHPSLAAHPAAAVGGTAAAVGVGAPSPSPARSNRRRSSIFNLFRRQSRSVAGGGLSFGQRACTSIKYDAESQRRLLVELEKDDIVVGGGGGDDAHGGSVDGDDAAAGQKRKASELIASPPRGGRRGGKTMAEAAALAAAEVGLEEIEPEDPSSPPKRISFSPALFGKMFSAFGGKEVPAQTDDAANANPVDEAAAASPAPPGLLRQSTSAARRSLVATVNLFSSVVGSEADIGTSNSSGRGGNDDDDIEPHVKRRRRSTWLSGLRFSTMAPAVADASSAAAAAEAVKNMDLVDDDIEDTPDAKRLRSLGKGMDANGTKT